MGREPPPTLQKGFGANDELKNQYCFFHLTVPHTWRSLTQHKISHREGSNPQNLGFHVTPNQNGYRVTEADFSLTRIQTMHTSWVYPPDDHRRLLIDTF